MPKTPQELWSKISSTISSSRYSAGTSGIQTSGTFKAASSNAIQNIVLRTKDRLSLHDSIREFLNSNNISWESSSFGSTTVTTFKVTSTTPHTRILVKPLSGREWLTNGYRNEALDTLIRRKSHLRFLRANPDTATEYEILKKFNDQIAKLGNSAPVDVVIKGTLYQDIIGMVPGPFGHKADFIGVDKDGNGQFFISHKDGTNSKSFQQYSGISSVAGKSIYDHKEVQEFRKQIAEKNREDFYNKGYYKKIEDSTLKQRAVFGKDFNHGKNNLSSNNINLFAQGNPVFRVLRQSTNKTRARFELTFSTKLITRGQIGDLKGDYEPTLFARQGESYRTVEYKSNKVRGVRAGIFTKGYIDGRRGVEPI